MKTIEFETELTGGDSLPLPPQVAAALPSSGKAHIVVLVERDTDDDSQWQQDVMQQFLSDDSPEDTSYDRYL